MHQTSCQQHDGPTFCAPIHHAPKAWPLGPRPQVYREPQLKMDRATKAFMPAIATMSLGKAGIHSLEEKLEAAASVGFSGIELFWDDFVDWAKGMNLFAAARSLRQLCDQLDLEILSLQPFRNYDGITSQELHDERIAEFEIWLGVARRLGAGCIGVPATIERDDMHTGDADAIAKDLEELAGLAKPFNIEIAYENLCFAAHTRTWEQAWDAISKAPSSENIGFLFDTFNICGSDYADPSKPSGVAGNGTSTLQQSIDKLVRTIPMSRIPFIQVADGERMTPPIGPDHKWMEGCYDAKMAWSRNARLFPFEDKGYLPVLPVIFALVRNGWSGWVSMEVFSRSTAKAGSETVRQHAARAWRSWEKLAMLLNCQHRPRGTFTAEAFYDSQ